MAISFSGNVKAEICRSFPQNKCCARAQCFGILLFCNSFSQEGIRIITESSDFAVILPKLFKKAFGLDFDSVPAADARGKQIFQIINPDKLALIMDSYGLGMSDTPALHINFPVIEEDCCKAAFFRGVFLAGGSITDPSKSYHLELSTTHHSVAREAYSLMQDVMGFYPKSSARKGCQVLYLKQSEWISDFLAYMGAPVASMAIIEARLEKELNNKVNRRCNCDDANTSKVVEASQEQLAAIRLLRERGALEHLPQKLLQAALAREKNPESSLTELAAMMDPPITKPAMSHRLKKLLELAKEMKQ